MTLHRLRRRSFAHDRPSYIRLAVAGVVAGLLVTSLNAFEHSTRNTLLADAQARAFWRDVVVTPAVTDETLEASLDATEGADTVWYASLELAGPTARLSEVQVAVVTEPVQSPPGDYWDGSVPPGPGTAAVSRSVATALDVGVGGSLDLDGQTFTVSGVYPTLADRGEMSAVAHVRADSSLTAGSPIRYVDRDDLTPFVSGSDRLVELRSVDTLFSDDPFRSTARRTAGVANGVAFPVAFLAGGLVAGALVVFLRGRRDDVDALVAAGMPGPRARRVFVSAGSAVVGAAIVAGCFASVLLFAVGRNVLASTVNQTWTGVHYSIALGVHLLVLALAVALAPRFAGWPAATTSRGSRTKSPPRVLVASAALLLVALGSWLVLRDGAMGPSVLVVVGLVIVLLAVLIPQLVAAVTRPRGRGLRALLAESGPLHSAVLRASVGLTVLSMLVGASLLDEVRALSEATDIPDGAFALEAVRLDDATTLADRYQDVTGRPAAMIPYPHERPGTSVFRATNGSAGSCLEQVESLNSECAAAVPLATVGQNPIGVPDADTWRIAPFLDDGSGEIVLIELDPTDGQVLSTQRAAATVDTTLLGSYGVGAVAPTGTSLTDESDSAFVLLRDFTSLSVREQAVVRELVFVDAGYSQAASAEVEDYGLLSLAFSTAGIGLALMFVLLVRRADQVWAEDKSVPWTIQAAGGATRTRLRVVALFALPQVVALLLAGAAAMLLGWSVARFPYGVFADFLWMLVGTVTAIGAVSFWLLWRASRPDAPNANPT
ncbi:MAG: hypothetical protein ABR616_05280 [Dermatophilaceae bacterium]